MTKWAWIRRQAILGAIFVPGMGTLLTFISEIDLVGAIISDPAGMCARGLALALIGAASGAGVGALRQDSPASV